MSSLSRKFALAVRRPELQRDAVDAWQRFESALPDHPLAEWDVEDRFDDESVGDYGCIAEATVHCVNLDPVGTRATIRLRHDYFDLSPKYQILTLLHETIHVELMSGSWWSRFDADRAFTSTHSVQRFDEQYNGKILVDDYAFSLAQILLKFQHEIAAERFLQVRYPHSGPARAAYLLEQAINERQHEPDWPLELRSFSVLYDLLRATLATDVSDTILRPRGERLHQSVESDLSQSDRPDLALLVPVLMDVHPDPPTVNTAAYRDLFQMTLRARPPQRETAEN
jgi:hypothetical protein